jgi:hypothetical protein
MSRPRPWARMSPAERIEAVRPLVEAGQANSIIAYRLGAPVSSVTPIAAVLRREIESQAKASEDNGATVPQDELREAADSVAGEVSRVDADRTASATSENMDVTAGETALASEKPAPPPAGDREPGRPTSSPDARDMATPKRWAQMSADDKRTVVHDMTMAGEGYVAIATLLDAPSRHCVAGIVAKLRKLGHLPPAKSKQSVGAEGGMLSRAKALKAKVARPTAADADVEAQPILTISRAAAFEPLPGVEPITLVQFGRRTCKFPVDGLQGPGRLFCGADKEPEQSFCAAHRRIAYTTTRERAA